MRAMLRALCCALGVLLVSGAGEARGPAPERVRAALLEMHKGGGLGGLTVTYDDLHGLHGGLTLTIHGDGRVEQRAVRSKAGTPKARVPSEDLRRLVALLVELQAWEQRVPERAPVPDESRAHLDIAAGGGRASMWEWYNDLPGNDRLLRVRELMKQLAWR